jgi:hypothetical protein
MEFKWQDLKIEDSLDIQEIEREDDDSLDGVCVSHTQDCGVIREQEKCQCGNNKDSHHSLCGACHSILPEDLQKDVDWCPEIYKAAIQYLTE